MTIKILPALILFTIFSNSLFAQLPTISYSNPQNYTANTAISPLVPVSSKVAMQGYSSIPVLTGPQFGAVRNIAVDGQGNIYAIDGVNRAIKKITAGGSLAITIASGFGAPNGLALDLKGNVYVTDDGTGLVKEVPVNGSPVITLASGFISPQGIATDAAGNIYVADAGNGSVKEIAANGGAAILIGPSFNGPAGVAVDAAGNIYVTESYGNDVKEIPANGTPVITIGSGFKSPQGIAIDASGNIFVDDNGNNAVKEILTGSHAVVTIGSGFNQPLSVATGLAGDIYVSDNAKQIKEIVPAGGYYLNVPLPAGLIFNNATGVISGTPLTVSPATNYLVTAYNSSGDHSATVNIAVSKAQAPTIGYSSPDTYMVGTAVSPLVPTSSKVTAAAYSSSPVSFGPRFSSASAIAADFLGNVYTVDAANKAVKKIPVSGGAVTTIGSGFIQPFGLATDAAGNVYVLDAGSGTGTAKIYKVPASGGATVTIASGLGIPGCITVDAAGNVYVSDAGVLKEVPVNGGAIFTLSTLPIAPSGVATDASGNIYFTEPNYAKVFKVPASGGTPVAVGFGFVQPQGVAVDASGNVFVADNGNNTVTEIQASGGAMVPVGSGFNQPYGVAAGPSGNIYISDNSSQRKEIIPIGGYYLTAPLPSGLNFSNVTGIISGTPTVVSPATNYTVTAYNSGTPATATVNIKVLPSSNAALASLSISSGTLTPGFAAGKVSYMASVGNAITSVTVTPAAAGTGATINVNGTAVTSGTASRPIQLNAGLNTITIVVTAQDGKTTGTYAVTLARARSSVATLANLVISSGTLSPSFSTGTTVYTASVANAITSITVAPTVTDATATITVNGKTVTSGTASARIPLNLGTDTVTTIVTAQDGITKATYKLIVTRLRSSVATLANLVINSGTLSPSFSTGTTVYTASVANAITSITVAPTVTDATATITVNGKTVTSGTASARIPLNLGTDTVTTIVTAQDGITKATYKVIVTRLRSSVATLANLVISSGTLSPSFSTGTTVYTASVANAITSITVAPTVTDATATITVNGKTVTSGTASTPIPLKLGTDTLTTIVTAQDGITKATYKVMVTRVRSSVATLANLAVSSGTLSPSFSTGTTSYAAIVAGTTTSITVTPTTTDTLATVTVNGKAVTSGSISKPVLLSLGSNIITTVVTAPDGVTKDTYTLTVTSVPSATVSYSSPQNYMVKTPLSPLVPTSSNVAAHAYSSSPVLVGPQFTSVGRIAVDVQGNIYAVDGAKGTVNKIPANGGPAITIAAGIGYTNGLAIDVKGNVYVTDAETGVVKEIPASGGPVITLATGFISPQGIAADNQGNVYVADAGNGSVKEIPVGGGPVVSTGYSFNNPSGVAVDVMGNVYVAESSGNDVKEILANGAGLSTLATGFKAPQGVAVDVSGNVFVDDYGNNAVKEIQADSNVVITIGSGFNQPFSVASGPAGNIYIADKLNQIKKLIPAGGYYLTVPLPAGLIFSNATGIISGMPKTVSPATNYTVTAYNSGTSATATVNIKVLPSANASLAFLNISSGTIMPEFVSNTTSYTVSIANTVTSITVTSSTADSNATVILNGKIVIRGAASDPIKLTTGKNTIAIVVTAQDGKTTETYTLTINRPQFPPAISYTSPQTYTTGIAVKPLSPTASGVAAPAYNSSTVTFASGFNTPAKVAIDAKGDFYVADYGNNVIKKIKAGGGAPVIIGSGFKNPTGVAVDAAGNVYVADAGNNAVKKIPAAGGNAVTIGSGFNQPADVAVDALGNVYVADAGNNAIKKIPVGSSAPVTLGLGFNDPFGIALDASGNVYFTDGNNGLYKIPAGGGYVVTVATGFNNPNGVAVDPSGNIYVADSGNGVIEMFPANGGPRVALGNNVGLPFYVAVDASGNLFVTDETNNVLHQIIPVGGYYLSTALPAGLGFSNSTGTISGTPTAVSPVTNYNITAYNLNGGSTATVTLTVKAPSNNTALTSFTDNYDDTYTGALINGFWCDSTVVSSTVTSLGFIAVTADPNATITINGIAVADGKVSAPFPLTANAVTFFTLVVTAADGFTKQTYPITVKKGPSNNTALTGLLANNGVTLSGAEVNGYWTMSATVGASVTSLNFTPTTADANAKVTINGNAVADKTASSAIAINVSGTTNITLIVTAPDGVTKQTYPIVITKSGTNASLRITNVLPDIFKTDSTVVANNILSPNGDGVNDTWMVRNIDLYPNNSVTVYDRIGHVVFAKKGYANDWAGTYGGSILNQGTYYYLLDLGNGSTSLKGFITVVRDR